MSHAIRRTTTAFAACAAVGVSSLFVGIAPASAAPSEACGADGTLVSAGICELTVTSGSATFTRTAQMTRLEVLLVGAGGASADQNDPNTDGYAAAGGGGDVKVVDFSSGTTDLTVTVAQPGVASSGSVDDGSTVTTVTNGVDASSFGAVGGASGTGFSGASGTGGVGYGAGGGASASPTAFENGGAGRVVSTLALASGSLFAGDSACYGGGGAIGTAAVLGTADCGGGTASSDRASIIPPTANSGGGAAGIDTTQTLSARTGASGVVVIRWTAATVSLGFSANGHGTAPASQAIVAGNVGVRPADPSAAGFEFRGWYSDASLSTPVDFSAPVTASTTYFASWSPLLAATGIDLNPVQVPLAFASLLVGLALVLVAYRRRPRTS